MYMFAAEVESGVMVRRIAISEIDRVVARRMGPTRVRGSAQPAVFNRQVAMYLARVVGGWSVTKIGKFYQGRHHTTVCYAVRRMTALRATNSEVDGLLTALTEEIRSQPLRDYQRRIHVIERMPSTWPWPTPEEFMEELVERLIARLKPSIEDAMVASMPPR